MRGYAFLKNERELARQYRDRYQELIELIKSGKETFSLTFSHNDYARNRYVGKSSLSEDDIALVCDRGCCCFGATVIKTGDDFTCSVFTD